MSPDGSKLLFGTYFGTSGNEGGNSTHNMALDPNGNAYLTTTSSSRELPVTKGALQTELAGGQHDIAVAKFSSDKGALLACTYLGGQGEEGADGIYTNASGDVFFTGTTSSSDFPVTSSAIQKERLNRNDAIVVMLSSNLSSLKYSSYLGGNSYDDGRSCFLDKLGSLYVTGSTNGSGWPMLNAHQTEFAGGGGGKELCYQGGCFAGDVILMKLIRIEE